MGTTDRKVREPTCLFQRSFVGRDPVCRQSEGAESIAVFRRRRESIHWKPVWRQSVANQTNGAYLNHFAGDELIVVQVKGKEQFEIVRDPAVIQSYLKRVEERKVLEYMKRPELLAPSGNPEEAYMNRDAYVHLSETGSDCPEKPVADTAYSLMKAFEKIKKNQERRLARKKYEARSRPDFDGELDTSKRRCGACGMVGHTSGSSISR